MRGRAMLAVAVAVLLGPACGEANQAVSGSTGGTVAVTLSDAGCQYEGPSQMRAGGLLVHVRNQTTDRVWLGLTPIKAGHTYADLVAYLDQERARELEKKPPLGPPDWGVPTSTMTRPESGPLDLDWAVSAGNYAFACGRHGTDAAGADLELGVWAAGPFLVT
jgi:hypothetical protein